MTKDPYAPPASRVEDVVDPSAPPRRPKLVWVIAAVYIFGGLWGLLSILLVRAGTFPTPPETQAYYAQLTLLDYALTAAVTTLNIIGAILLFRLRSQAAALLASAVGLSILSILYQLTTGALRALLNSTGGVGIFFSL